MRPLHGWLAVGIHIGGAAGRRGDVDLLAAVALVTSGGVVLWGGVWYATLVLLR